MYKKNSQNMQRRAGAIDLVRADTGEIEVSYFEMTDREKRGALGRQKDIYSRRVQEIRRILRIAPGVQIRNIKGAARNTPEFMEWSRLVVRIQEIDEQIRDIPKNRDISGQVAALLKKRHPEIYEKLRQEIEVRP